MQHSSLSLKKYRLPLLLAALSFGLSSAPAWADDASMNIKLTANIIANTCKIGLSNGGQVLLPVVPRDWFSNADGSDKYTATKEAGGTKFAIKVIDCEDYDKGAASKLHFSFRPQSGVLAQGNNQVFANDLEQSSTGAKNVGIVVFSADLHQNVLQQNGSSDVVYDVTSKQQNYAYLTQYEFTARYQNTGSVTAGRVTSHVLVSVTYE
ncbi:fimbrial protein [Enterobacter sp. RHBSTW-00994]|nr:fimbrial protein [Enterobacter sp. RHBSTW-00994]